MNLRSVDNDFVQWHRCLRIGHLQIFECLNDNVSDDEIAKPSVIGWDNVPRSVGCIGAFENFFVGIHVVIPMFSCDEIAGVKFPTLFRFFKA